MTSQENFKSLQHVGIIMDGNRRWARERNLSSIDGHMKGYELAKKVPGWFFDRGVKVVSLFSFSTENWKRPEEEVSVLMALLKRAIDEETGSALENGHKILVSGRLNELPGGLFQACLNVMEKTKHGKNGIINICMNYGGRFEVVDAVKKIVESKVEVEAVNEELFRKSLYFPDLPDPDIIIRTSGEERLSGFLLWQAAYSEFFFLKKYWPELEERDVENIINEYKGRSRRFGGS